jgi:DNA-binding GntR family transcriptional regulator
MLEINPAGNLTPRYMQVHDILLRRIGDGTYTHQIPPGSSLALEFGVAYGTVSRAIQVLKDDGQVISRRGQGTFITARQADHGNP